MKKLFAALLALGMLLSLCACAAEESGKKETKKKETKSDFTLGTIDGENYENTYIGLGCNLDEDWRYYSDAEISEISGIAMDRVEEDARKLLEDAAVVFDMYAANGADTINVNLEKCSAAQLKNIDIAQNLNALIPMLKSVYEGSGYSDITSQVISVELDGKDHFALRTEAKLMGSDVYLLQLQFPCQEHMASLTIVSFGIDNTVEYLDYFYLTE